MAFVFAPLFSGSSGNALYARCGENSVLIDAGLAAKKIEAEAAKAGGDLSALNAIFVTHEHADHIAGVGILMRKYHVPVYATGPTWEAMEGKLGKIPDECVHEIRPGGEVDIGCLHVRSFPIPHDAACPVGYTIEHGGHKVAVATDLGHIEDTWMDAAAGADILLLEANHDVDTLRVCRYPYELKMRILGPRGHLSNDDAGKAAAELAKRGVRSLILGHLSQENNFPQLAWESVAMQLRREGINIPMAVASRSGLSGVYPLDEETGA